jgi:predicted transcriptional regulator
MNRNDPERTAMPAAFTVRLEDEILAALDRLAEQTDRSRAWLVSRAVEDYISLNEWQIERIKEGIAAADRGDFASDEEMQRIRRKFSGHK